MSPPSSWSRQILCLLPLLLAAACAAPTPAPTPAPRPTPTILTVYLQPELDPLRPALAACTDAVPETGVIVFLARQDTSPQGSEALLIRMGAELPEGVQAALLGFERIVLVAGAGSRLTVGSEMDVRALFSGESPDRALWVPLPGTAMRSELDRVMETEAYSPDSFLAPNAEAVVAALFEDPAALGLLPAAWLTDDLETVYELAELPVLAVTEKVPEGRLRELIGCLQLNPVYGEGE